MKDLISIFAYCPDDNRKKILQDLLTQLQPIKDKFDIMVVAHSSISDLSYAMVDHYYYDKDNRLLYDFDVRKKHWFTNDLFDINTTLAYPPSTHLAIYSLLYYTFNFSNFKGYKKIHCIEYDINIVNLNLFVDVSNTLDNFDTVMFRGEDAKWIYGTYFAFSMNNFPSDYFIYDEEKILDFLRESETKMTEEITDRILTPNGRTIFFEPLSKLDPAGIFQKVDSHMNEGLMWCVPLCDYDSDVLLFFVYNENGGEYDVNIIVNNQNHFHIKIREIGCWEFVTLGDINDINSILVLVNNKINKSILINRDNIDMFRKYNFIKNR
jgi:hypothetical protein